MSSQNKTISVNASAFSSVKKNKTRRNRGTAEQKTVEKTSLQSQTNRFLGKPILSPAVLKNKLIKRVSEHKKQEIKDAIRNPTEVALNFGDHSNPDLDTENKSANEFDESLDYLQLLTKQRKREADKIKQEERRKSMENRTLRVHVDHDHDRMSSFAPDAMADFPEVTTSTSAVDNIHLRPPYVFGGGSGGSGSPPYSNLKVGGTGGKPTYKEWARTQRTYPSLQTDLAPISYDAIQKEHRVQQLREKIKTKQEETYNQNLAKQIALAQPHTTLATSATPALLNQQLTTPPTQPPPLTPPPPTTPIIARKYTTTKTIRKKYVLGKSENKPSVSVLLKNKNTQRQILQTQKELRQVGIDEIKNYLLTRNLIKIGSTAPTDVLRKMYEASILSGDVVNTNTDVMLHNALHSKDSNDAK